MLLWLSSGFYSIKNNILFSVFDSVLVQNIDIYMLIYIVPNNYFLSKRVKFIFTGYIYIYILGNY